MISHVGDAYSDLNLDPDDHWYANLWEGRAAFLLNMYMLKAEIYLHNISVVA